ncbi:MAG TPA: succinate dehydrogenase/fumarate reductase iron-sulfur subunit [Chloroflexota bacterium]|nr:succinate dehydrogenase/fumarate reductase iron-sulfur subunit [Chloroflexota bacterium]
MSWRVNFRIFRYKQDGSAAHYDAFALDVRPDEYVLDGVERIWAEHDRTLVFRHACHHAGCGACAMRVNGRERLTCITRIDAVTQDGGTVTVEPLRNLPVVSDLLVDMSPFYSKLELAQFVPVRQAEPMIDLASQQVAADCQPAMRFENCLECGICVSACPAAGTDPDYLGPAALAAIARMVAEPRGKVDPAGLFDLADCEQGLWRCHTAFECTEACPGNVQPGTLIMALRRQALSRAIKRLFGARS